MSDSIHTKDTQNTKEVTPSVGVKRSISWASDVKLPRKGGMRMGAKWVPLIDKESIQVDTNGDDEQDDESDGVEQASESDEEEVDVKSDGDGEGGQSQSQQSQARAMEAEANNTRLPQSRSFATASKAASSGLPNEAAFSPSRWGNK